MIFYFSATGNCKYVATRIAEATNDEMVSIVDCFEKKELSFKLSEGEALGFIVPTYAWALPLNVDEFLKAFQIKYAKKPYVYFIATYGTTPGNTGFIANRILKRNNGLTIDAYYSIQMPDTWTPIFDLSDKEAVARTSEKVEPQLTETIQAIGQGATGNFMNHKVPAFTIAFCKTYYNNMRKTKNFYVEDSCVSCGLCAAKCPAKAIEMKDGKPVWVVDQCIMCLGCLHRCPKFSIQYGKKTKEHGQYTNPNVSV